jgi:hypothetical protein
MTRTYQHDAEWQLQQERVINEQIVEAERRKHRASRPGNERLKTVIVVIDPEPDELAAADRMANKVADRAGLTPEGLAEVLEALGLTGGRTLSRIKRVQADRLKPISRCAHCGNRMRTRADGAFVAHPAKAHQSTEADPCPGSGKRDRAEEVA